MEWKGYVSPEGKVIGLNRDLRHDEEVIGMLRYKETHYNLRRYLVSRVWVANFGQTLANNTDESHFASRREAIEWLLKRAEAATPVSP